MNLGNHKQEVIFSPGWTKNKKVTDPFADKKYKIDKFEVKLDLAPKTFRILINDD